MRLRSLFGLALISACVIGFTPRSDATIHIINVDNFSFTPPKTTVNYGDTVRWVLSSGTHTTTSDGSSAKTWNSGILSLGTPFSIVINAGDGPGPFPYHCSFHLPTMVDTLFVNAPTDSDGDGLFDNDELALSTNPNDPDSDGDNVDDFTEVGGNVATPLDTDLDGQIDALDPDDDGDGVPTILEDPNTNNDPTDDDIDSDATPNYRDNDDDNDLVLTQDEDPNMNNDPTDDDTDADLTPNYLDDDDDADGILTVDEDVNMNNDPTDDDTDADLVPNYLDDDDDDDGVLTLNDACPLIPNPCPGCCNVAGDADNGGSVNIGDVTFLISRIFAGGPAPACCEEGDANGNGSINIGDATYLIARIFSGGPAPVCGPSGMLCSGQ